MLEPLPHIFAIYIASLTMKKLPPSQNVATLAFGKILGKYKSTEKKLRNFRVGVGSNFEEKVERKHLLKKVCSKIVGEQGPESIKT